jgi:tetratricopeptide (TPR) repeat protein
LEDALSRSDGSSDPELARARLSAAYLALFECDYAAAARHGEPALAAYRELTDPAQTARALSLLASVERERGRYDRSLARYSEVAEIYREAEVEAGLADTQLMAGFTAWLTGDLDQAEILIEDGQRRFHLLADPEGVASARVHLAAVAHYRGESARARWLAEDALARFRELGFDEGIAWALNVLGLIEQRDGHADPALECLAASLAAHCRVGDRWRTAAVLEALAAVLAADSPAAAAELLGAASAIRDAIGAPVPPQEAPAVDAALTVVHSGLADGELYRARARGEALRLGDLPGRLAELRLGRGDVQSGPADMTPLVALGNRPGRP